MRKDIIDLKHQNTSLAALVKDLKQQSSSAQKVQAAPRVSSAQQNANSQHSQQ